LAVDLDADGQRTPIMVRPHGGEYEVIRGNRLAFAAQRLGWIEIEANVVPCDEKTAYALALESNMERSDIGGFAAESSNE
jgi:ParB-like chromosome segregation protein Spo0J